MMFDLSGKVALVAGGAGYLALPACKGLAEHGAKVMVADIKKDRLEKAVQELSAISSKDNVAGIHLDISDETSIKSAMTETLSRFGRLDVTVNATWFSVGKRVVEELTAEEFDRSNRINITGSFLLAREAAQAMANGGSIIMYTSMYGKVAPVPDLYRRPMNPNPIEYGVAKAGIAQMVRYLAAHYGRMNIRLNAVMPGAFPWPSQQREDPDFIKRLASRTMLGRIGRQNETAGAVVFLASDEATFITGHILSIDGGWTAW